MSRTAALAIDDFALFARVAELRSLAAVAREREVPASQVSRALARIERLCGARLVHRSTHGLSLTEEGDAVAAHAAQVLGAAAALDAELDQRRGEPSGTVRVACSPAMAHFLLPGLQALLDLHPRLCLDLAVDDRTVDMAREGIDIAIRTGAPTSDTVVARQIGAFTRRLYAAPSYLKRFGTPKSTAELARHRLIANSASPTLNRWPVVNDGVAGELQIEGHTRTDNSAVVLALVLEGAGIARAVDLLAAPLVQSGRLVTILQKQIPERRVPIYAVMLKERHRLPKLRACIDYWEQWLADVAATLPAVPAQAPERQPARPRKRGSR